MCKRIMLIVLCLTFDLPVSAQLVINTIAGGYVPNNVPAKSASIGNVVGLAIGPSGALYVATSNAVYKIGANGNLVLYAGTGYVAPPLGC